MTPRQSAIKKFQEFLSKSEATRAMPKPAPVQEQAPQGEEAPSEEALEALRSLTQEG